MGDDDDDGGGGRAWGIGGNDESGPGASKDADPWGNPAGEKAPKRIEVTVVEPPEDPPEIIEELEPASEASLDVEENQETQRRRAQAKSYEMTGSTRISVNSFA